MTPRDKLLATILPAILLAGAYGYFVLSPRMKALEKARQDLAAIQSKVPANTVSGERARLAELMQEIAVEKKKLVALNERWQSTLGRQSPPLNRPERIERLHQVLDESGVRILDDSDLDSTKSSHSSPFLDSLGPELRERCGQPPPRLRVVHFHARYSEVATALIAISQAELLAVPVGLSMKPSRDDAGYQEWTLHVWV